MPLTFDTWYAQHDHNGQTVKELAYAAWLAGRDTLIRPAQMRRENCHSCGQPEHNHQVTCQFFPL